MQLLCHTQKTNIIADVMFFCLFTIFLIPLPSCSLYFLMQGLCFRIINWDSMPIGSDILYILTRLVFSPIIIMVQESGSNENSSRVYGLTIYQQMVEFTVPGINFILLRWALNPITQLMVTLKIYALLLQLWVYFVILVFAVVHRHHSLVRLPIAFLPQQCAQSLWMLLKLVLREEASKSIQLDYSKCCF